MIQVWVPRLTVRNDVGEQKSESLYELPVTITSDGKVQWLRLGFIVTSVGI